MGIENDKRVAGIPICFRNGNKAVTLLLYIVPVHCFGKALRATGF
jgi:hypothetical protein